MVAEASGGSFRDADKILEQLVMEKVGLREKSVEEFLFNRKSIDIDAFLMLLSEKETKKALIQIERATKLGVSSKIFIENLLSRLRDALLAEVGVGGEPVDYMTKDKIVRLLKLFSNAASELPHSFIEQLPIEIAVVEWCESNKDDNRGNNRKHNLRDEKDINEKIEEEGKLQDKPLGSKDTKKLKKQKNKVEISEKLWLQILSKVKPINTSTEALLRAVRPIQYDGSILELGVYYQFHKERLESNLHRTILEDVVTEVFERNVRVMCTLTEPPSSKNTEENTNPLAKEEGTSEESDSLLTDADDEDIIRVAKEIFSS